MAPALEKEAPEPSLSTAQRQGAEHSHTIPFALEASETFDVGSDTGTGINDEDYQAPFGFTGKLNMLTIKLEPQG